MKRRFIINLSSSSAALLVWLSLWGSLQAVESQELDAIEDALERHLMADARARLAKLDADEDFRLLFLRGRLAFYEGDYPLAVQLMREAVELGGTRARSLESELRIVEATAEVTKEHVRVLSADGRFSMSHPPGKDAVLVELAFESMAAAYDALAEDFGVRPEAPIRMEVYASAEDLAKVSSLTQTDIVTTGTIALSKYNRIMLTSPLALVRGYGWIDTLVHEYAHMVIAQAGGPTVPIWLHEGLAKFSERRWRGEERILPAYLEYLLFERASAGRLVSFEEMHPSIAKLPDQEDASMAYAEVFAAIELVYTERGGEGLREILARVASGRTAEAALAEVMDTSFEAFLLRWQQHMLTRPRRYQGTQAPDVFEQVAFRKDASVGELDDISLIGEEGARRLVFLGDLLLAKGRPKAAAVEYRKAVQLIGSANPVLQARLGRALLEQGEPGLAIEALQAAQLEGENYMTLFVYLARALLQEQRWDEGQRALWEAAAINPFDPMIHEQWRLLHRHRGDGEGLERATAMVELLGQR